MAGGGFVVNGEHDGRHVAFAVVRRDGLDPQRIVGRAEMCLGRLAEIVGHVGVAVVVGFDVDVHVDRDEVGDVDLAHGGVFS